MAGVWHGFGARWRVWNLREVSSGFEDETLKIAILWNNPSKRRNQFMLCPLKIDAYVSLGIWKNKQKTKMTFELLKSIEFIETDLSFKQLWKIYHWNPLRSLDWSKGSTMQQKPGNQIWRLVVVWFSSMVHSWLLINPLENKQLEPNSHGALSQILFRISIGWCLGERTVMFQWCFFGCSS